LCELSFRLPNNHSDRLALATTTTITFNLSSAFLHYVQLQIAMESVIIDDETQVTESTVNDTVAVQYILGGEPEVLSSNTRTYQTTYVILESDNPATIWSTTPTSLWGLTQVFAPKDPESVSGTENLYDYLQTTQSGTTFTIQLVKTDYFVYNKEAIVTEVGELILSIVLVVHVCLGLFEVLSAVVEGIEFAVDKFTGKEEHKRAERIEAATSPRGEKSNAEKGYLAKRATEEEKSGGHRGTVEDGKKSEGGKSEKHGKKSEGGKSENGKKSGSGDKKSTSEVDDESGSQLEMEEKATDE